MLIKAAKDNGEEAFVNAEHIYVIRKKTSDKIVNEVMTVAANEYLGRTDDDELQKWADYVSSYNHERTVKLLNISNLEDDGK